MQIPSTQSQSEASLHAIDYWQVLKNRYSVILVTFFLVIITAAVITYVMPKKYESMAVIEVKPIANIETTLIRSGGLMGVQMTKNFFNTQFEIIVASETLKRVSQKLHLPRRWQMSESEAVDVLQDIVKTRQRKGTDMIEIIVRSKKKDEAKEIAEAVYEAYRDRRTEMEMHQRKRALEAMKNELQDKNDRVAELRKSLADLAEKVGVILDPTAMNRNFAGMTGASLSEKADRDLYEMKKEKDLLVFQIKKLLTVTDDELISLVSEFPDDVGYKEAYTKYEDAGNELEAMRASGLGEKHPEIEMRKSRLGDLKKTLAKRAVTVRESLKQRLTLLEGRVVRMEKVRDQTKNEGMRQGRAFQQLKIANQEYENARNLRDQMQIKYDTEKANESIPTDNISVHHYPEVRNTPVSPSVPLNLGVGAAIGLFFGIGIAFALELLDTSVKSLEDVERFLKVPVLAVIPRDIGLLHQQSGTSPDAEAYRILRTNIEFNRKNPDDNAITVVSGGAGEGKSTTMVNLAYICAQGGYSTLIIDADLRRPRMHTFFGLNNTVGLTNYLTTELLLEDVILQTPVENLYFMPSGVLPADAAGILNSRRMSELLADVKQRFDLVLLDSPPILGVSDASVLSSEADLTMIVVQHRKLPRNMLMRVKEAVENVGGTIIGVVLNNVDIRSDNQYQYYTSYYTYYAPTSDDPKEKPQKRKSSTKGESLAKEGNQKNDIPEPKEDLY